jgi:KaiC/GvpD/RAD55 family RecA-like ATPase
VFPLGGKRNSASQKTAEQSASSIPPSAALPNKGATAAGDDAGDLKKWLSGDDDLLTWLNEGEAVTEGEEYAEDDDLAVIKQQLAERDAEIAQLKSTIDAAPEAAPTPISEASDIEEQNDLLRAEVQRLMKLNQDLNSDFQNTLKSMPRDQAELMQKELNLRERESLLGARERVLHENGGKDGQQSNGECPPDLEERFHAELREKEAEFLGKEKDYRAKIDYLAEELKRKTIEDRMMEDELKLVKMNAPEAEKALDHKLKDIQFKEKKILVMEEEIAKLKIELRERDDELKKIKDVVGYKEQEILRREEDLLYREKLLLGERRKFDEAKKETVGIDEVEMQKRLEALKAEVKNKEEELITKEKFLNAKMEELRMREQGVIEDEIVKKEEERSLEIKVAKVKTGNSRFDDLLLGGIPFGSNILIHGPPFIGKEIMVGQFVSEGLKKGVPVIWVITDKTPREVREEMNSILSGYEEYEKLGLVKYVDSYSRSMGEKTNDPYTVYVDEPTDHDKMMDEVEKIAKEFKEKHQYYRLAFRSLSTLIAYSDPTTAFRFLNPFSGRRKRDGAVSMYTIEKGMHGEQEIQMLGSIMDGMVDFKLDQLRSFFSVQGICDVQSRSYIRYTVSKHGLSIGSFSLDHIR